MESWPSAVSAGFSTLPARTAISGIVYSWMQLQFEQIADSVGRAALDDVGLAHLEQLATFAFADGEIEDTELADFETALADLGLSPSPQLSILKQRMQRGREMTKIRAGELPIATPSDIHLDSDEVLYLDVHAQLIRYLANGPKTTPGRLLVSNKKIRFIGTGGGQTNWDKIVGVRRIPKSSRLGSYCPRHCPVHRRRCRLRRRSHRGRATDRKAPGTRSRGTKLPFSTPARTGRGFSDAAGVVASNADRRPTSNTTT